MNNLKDYETIKVKEEIDSDDEISDEFIEKLDKIHLEMLNGNCVKFKDINELSKRYDI